MKKHRNLWVIPAIILVLVILTAGVFILRPGQNTASSKKNAVQANLEDGTGQKSFTGEYGVFVGADNTQLDRIKEYQTVVIDASYFTKDDINSLHENGQTVYTYLNIGSLESFRDYYGEYAQYTLSAYDNWSEERWMDVSVDSWQKFISQQVAKEYLDKGVDGFFVDNCDVYYKYKGGRIYTGIVNILTTLMSYNKEVIINGGDTFISEYMKRGEDISAILTGVDQECVATSIDFDNNTFTNASEDTKTYYKEYFDKLKELKTKIYIIEYTKDKDLAETLKAEYTQEGYTCYIADSIELK